MKQKQKQKIVIEVPLHCAKCNKKIMEICTTAEGFMSITTHRGDKDRVEIIGEGFDATRVTKRLREKANKYSKLVRVTKVEDAN